VLRDMGMLNFDEPFQNLLTQGMVTLEGSKMSKSKGNVISPDEVVARYGADTIRGYIMFMAPPDKELAWSPDAVEGMFRFLGRVWRLVGEYVELHDGKAGDFAQQSQLATAGADVVGSDAHTDKDLSDAEKTLRLETHKLIKKATEDIDRQQFNTTIAALMELTNALYDFKKGEDWHTSAYVAFAIDTLLKMLAPIAPHITEELWLDVHGEAIESIHLQDWPSFNPEFVVADTIELPVQVNGKVRGRIMVDASAADEEVAEAAKAAVAEHIEGKEIRKLIVVSGRIVTIVV